MVSRISRSLALSVATGQMRQVTVTALLLLLLMLLLLLLLLCLLLLLFCLLLPVLCLVLTAFGSVATVTVSVTADQPDTLMALLGFVFGHAVAVTLMSA